jgi:4,5-dihydroxyphthalate decarboxylase
MAEPLRLVTALLNHGQTDALRDGTVVPTGIVLQHVEVDPPHMIYRRQVRTLEFDVAEMATTTFLCAKSFNKPISAIPVFSNRDLYMSPMVYNVKSGIKGPGDLEGKRVGLRSYTVTNNTLARAFLKSEFGVDTDNVTWVVSEDAHVAEYKEPSNVEYAPPGRTLEEMLLAGDIDVGIQVQVKPGGDIRPLLSEEEAAEVGLRSYRRTGLYPIGHIMTIKDSTLEAHPWIAAELYAAFKASKEQYLAGLRERTPLTGRDKQNLRNQEIVGGDPLPYGLARNRKDLEAMIQIDYEQHVIPQPLALESLFAHGFLDFE